jgi:hypothetical protein
MPHNILRENSRAVNCKEILILLHILILLSSINPSLKVRAHALVGNMMGISLREALVFVEWEKYLMYHGQRCTLMRS